MATERPQELTLALLSLFEASTPAGGRSCAEVLDAATKQAATTPSHVAASAGVTDIVTARFGAARLLNSLCGACAMCARGSTGESPKIIERSLRP
jgi:hypothetical protein